MNSQLVEQTDGHLESDTEFTHFLTFMLNDETYGVSILEITEIIDYGSITKVPMMPDFIAGVINLRGSVVPVVDLALRFSEQPSVKTSRSSIVVIEIKDEDQVLEIGITVDVVNEVLEVSEEDIEPAPAFGTKIRNDFISGMAKRHEELLVILNISNVLSIDELSYIV